MEELLKQILIELKDLKQGQKDLQQGQKNLEDRLDTFEKKTIRSFSEVDNKIDGIYSAVADLMEFRTEAESRLKKIK